MNLLQYPVSPRNTLNLDMLVCLGQFVIDLIFFWIYLDSFRYYMTKMAHFFLVECAFGHLGVELIFFQNREHLFQMYEMVLPCLTVYKDVIKKTSTNFLRNG